MQIIFLFNSQAVVLSNCFNQDFSNLILQNRQNIVTLLDSSAKSILNSFIFRYALYHAFQNNEVCARKIGGMEGEEEHLLDLFLIKIQIGSFIFLY